MNGRFRVRARPRLENPPNPAPEPQAAAPADEPPPAAPEAPSCPATPEDEDTSRSEFRGHDIETTDLSDQYQTLRRVAGPRAAREFAIREAMALFLQGATLEIISKKFDVSMYAAHGWVNEGRSRMAAEVDSFDAKTYVGLLLDTLQLSESVARAVLLNKNAGGNVRMRAAETLLKLVAGKLVILEKFGLTTTVALGQGRADDPRVNEARRAFAAWRDLDQVFFADVTDPQSEDGEEHASQPPEEAGEGVVH